MPLRDQWSLTKRQVNKKDTDKSEGSAATEIKDKEPQINAEAEERHQIRTLDAAKTTVELLIAGFIAKHNLTMALADHLVALVNAVCPGSQIAENIRSVRPKTIVVIKDTIRVEKLARVSSLTGESCYSLMIDETMDRSTNKALAVVARVYDSRMKATKDLFVYLVEVKDASAGDIHRDVPKVLSNKVPFSNVIRLGADNASVMTDKHRGVQTLLKKGAPHILVTGCVCTSLHLYASAACLKLPPTVEDLARDVSTTSETV
ncbi:uncharacterized protein LOC119102742 [Pollicipes pollicipes]|uniref:uncharacterized protein LOC119102742 n=1 Tax=Pollicipes pollicipes TaxID=41117 RepID=UPI0018852E56|nr:uncharacterized protein LOC119102742 [Pollicipes pollicipes]